MMMDLVIVKTFDNYFTANIWLTRLTNAGIEARLLDENVVTTIPFLSNIVGGIKLVVNKADEATAREMLQSMEEEIRAAVKCPKCGTAGFEQVDVEQTRQKSTSILGRIADNYFLNSGFIYRCRNCGFETEDLPEPDEQSLYGAMPAPDLTDLKIIAMIPARYASTRFPFKLMQPLGDKTVIRHTYDNVVATGLFDEVYVVTDSEEIFSEIVNNGGMAITSIHTHESGSDRIAEALDDRDADIVVNVQGDEPFITKDALLALINCFADDAQQRIKVASLMKRMNHSDITDPNIVKVVTNASGEAIYFSRSPVPYYRDEVANRVFYEHIGVYAYRKQALMDFTQWPVGYIENIEKLEQLRYIENGYTIQMAIVQESSVKIDVPEDLAKAELYLTNLNQQNNEEPV